MSIVMTAYFYLFYNIEANMHSFTTIFISVAELKLIMPLA